VLAVGQATEILIRTVAPTTPGVVDFGAEVDPNNVIPETNEGNNTDTELTTVI
jgi:hypothetical protein